MKQKIKEKSEDNILDEIEDEEACAHFWDIETANGPSSQGICKYCGEIREFLNAFPDINPLKRKSSPLDLPKLPDVKVDKNSKS